MLFRSSETITYAAHGLNNGDTVTYNNGGSTSITGLTSGTSYYVVGKTTNTFQVSATSGGSAINLTGTDSVAYRPKKPLLRIEFSANEQNNFASLTLNSGSGVAQLPVISGAHLERSDLPRSDARTINRG